MVGAINSLRNLRKICVEHNGSCKECPLGDAENVQNTSCPCLTKPNSWTDEENETEWWMKEEDVEPVSETIVIYRNDREVIAMDKLTGKKATAKCDPWDRFDFHTGAKLAFSRLFDEEEECLNTKIVFIKGDEVFKTGHAYEIIDGKIKNKGYSDFPRGEKIKNIEDLKYYFSGKGRYSNYRLEFVEIKED